MSNKETFTPEYKREIVRLVTEQGQKFKNLAAEIGVSETSIYTRRRQCGEHGEDAYPWKGNLRSEDEKVRKFKKELADLKEENEI